MPFEEDIQPGDVLLFRGRSFISWGIRFFDGNEVNHAAVAVDGGQLAYPLPAARDWLGNGCTSLRATTVRS